MSITSFTYYLFSSIYIIHYIYVESVRKRKNPNQQIRILKYYNTIRSTQLIYIYIYKVGYYDKGGFVNDHTDEQLVDYFNICLFTKGIIKEDNTEPTTI